ncbi:MAG: tripartite tricarboxylate transporter substrate binding protein [Burkholderiales bacterium]|nr:tripartite tricarboxylate transporter substrate binding protein [Burkholderiales bacterium]
MISDGSLRSTLLLAAALLGCAAHAHAEYPERPLRFIVPQAAGSASDTSARIIAVELGRILGQQVVVDNRPGGGLTIGINMVVRAAADGYTLGYGNIGGLAINRSMMKVPYDALIDIQPVAQTNSNGMLLAVAPQLPARSVRELIDYAKAHPGKLSNASSGNGTPGHFGGELFKDMAGVDIVHVPYKGGAAAMTEMMTGRVQVMFESMSSIVQHHRSGKLRGLALTSLKRSSSYPDIPTLDESGVPGYDMTVWSGLITPPGIGKPVLAKLNDAINKALVAPGLREKYAANGVETVGGTAEEFRAFIRREVEKYAAISKKIGVKVE